MKKDENHFLSHGCSILAIIEKNGEAFIFGCLIVMLFYIEMEEIICVINS